MLLLGALWTIVAFTLGTRGLWYDEIAAWRDYGSPADGRTAWWCLTHWFDPANHPLQTFASRLLFSGSQGWEENLPSAFRRLWRGSPL